MYVCMYVYIYIMRIYVYIESHMRGNVGTWVRLMVLTTTTHGTWPCSSFVQLARASVAKNHAKFRAKSQQFLQFRSQIFAIFGAEHARTTCHTHTETIKMHHVPCSLCVGILSRVETRCARVARKFCMQIPPKLARFRPNCA